MKNWSNARKSTVFGSRWAFIIFFTFFTLVFFLYRFSAENFKDFQLSQESNVLLREITNNSDHPFPYTAAVIVCTCLFGIAAIIICLGGDL
jgi:ABC-type phosphate transport system permease subunit